MMMCMLSCCTYVMCFVHISICVVGSPFAFQQFRLGLFPQLITFLILMSYAFTIATSLTIFFLATLTIALMIQIVSSFITATATEIRQQREGELRLHYGRIASYVESITFFR